MTRVLAWLLAACTLLLGSGTLHAQNWPERPIRLVVPYTAGGQFDIVARMVAERASGPLGVPIVVENRPGAGTMIGAAHVAQSPNDGYTLLFAGANMFAISPHTFASLPVKRSDFQTVSLVSELPMGLIVHSSVPARTLAEFIAYAKANPDKISFGTSGEAGAQHLLCELIKDRAGITMTHVGYKGTAQVLQDLIPGRVTVACDGLVAYAPHARQGTLRILGVSSSRRLPSLPDVPTFAEAGIPDATVASWGGIVAPAGLPAPVLKRLHTAIVAAAELPEVRQKIADGAALPRTTTPEEFDAIIASDYAKWGAVVKKLGLKPQ
jgi:tripartite-type tricarboxylate transporter receptor subunit TctC